MSEENKPIDEIETQPEAVAKPKKEKKQVPTVEAKAEPTDRDGSVKIPTPNSSLAGQGR